MGEVSAGTMKAALEAAVLAVAVLCALVISTAGERSTGWFGDEGPLSTSWPFALGTSHTASGVKAWSVESRGPVHAPYILRGPSWSPVKVGSSFWGSGEKLMGVAPSHCTSRGVPTGQGPQPTYVLYPAQGMLYRCRILCVPRLPELCAVYFLVGILCQPQCRRVRGRCGKLCELLGQLLSR